MPLLSLKGGTGTIGVCFAGNAKYKKNGLPDFAAAARSFTYLVAITEKCPNIST